MWNRAAPEARLEKLTKLALLLALGGLARGGAAMTHWRAQLVPRPVEPRRRLEVLLDPLGQSRVLLARILWVKADLYHELLERTGVPFDQERDILPLYRMITYLDPAQASVFDLLAADLESGYQDHKQALAILQEGIACNPESYALYYRKALLLWRHQEFSPAAGAARQALALANGELQTVDCCRILNGCYQHERDWPAALKTLDLWLRWQPLADRPRQERIKILGLIRS